MTPDVAQQQTDKQVARYGRNHEPQKQYSPLARRNAERFSTERFERELVGYLDEVIASRQIPVT